MEHIEHPDITRMERFGQLESECRCDDYEEDTEYDEEE